MQKLKLQFKVQGYLLIISVIFTLLFPAVPAFGAELFFGTKNQELTQGDEFLADIFVNTEGESINAVEGSVVFPADLLEVREIRDGNSIINFWIENPHIEASSVVLFSGITPGGFSGANNSIFSIVFEAKNAGVASIVLQDTKALRNDGLGTETTLSTRDAAVSIKSGDSNVRKEKLMDTEPPEDFKPIIENDSNIFDGKYFLVFATQDKTSGIANYKVREGEWGWFSVVESPYLLKYQSLDRKIFVKAIDKAGNERVVALNAQQRAPWYRYYTILGILLVMVIVGFFLKKLWSRFIK